MRAFPRISIDRLARVLRYFGTGIFDQLVLSGANFVAGFLMIRYTSDTAYAQFVLAQSAILLLQSAQGAWLSGPVTAIAPRKTAEQRRLMIGALQSSQTRTVRLAVLGALIIAAGGGLIGLWTAETAVVAGATACAGGFALQRYYLRSVLLIYSKPQSMLRADLVYVAVLIAGIAVAALVRHTSGVIAIAALVVASWAGTKAAYRMFASETGWVTGDSREFWRELRVLGVWATVGAVIWWLYAQSYNFILAARLNLTAVADVNATRLVLMPAIVFSVGIQTLLMPVAANWLARFDVGTMVRRLAVLTVAILCLDLVYFDFAWIFRGWIVGDLLHKVIGDRDSLLLLWGCITLIFVVREALQAALYSLGHVRPMAWIAAVAAVVSLSLMWFGISLWGAAAVLIGQIAGDCVLLVGLSSLLWKISPRGALSRA